jgi:hypothetical protein
MAIRALPTAIRAWVKFAPGAKVPENLQFFFKKTVFLEIMALFQRL